MGSPGVKRVWMSDWHMPDGLDKQSVVVINAPRLRYRGHADLLAMVIWNVDLIPLIVTKKTPHEMSEWS